MFRATKQVVNIKSRTVLLFLFATIGIVIFFMILFYSSIEQIIESDYYSTLKLRNEIVAHYYVTNKKDKVYSLSEDSLQQIQPHELNYVFELQHTKKQDICDSLDVPIGFVSEIYQNGYANYQNDNLQYVGSLYDIDDLKFIVINFSENYFNKHVQSQLQKLILISLLACILLTMLISYYLSKSLFKPIIKITNKVKAISSQNLHLRIEEESKNSELNQLIQTFNQMLNRMEASFATQNNFISNASHELRTPLTSIMGLADVTLSKKRQVEEYEETLQAILTESEKLDKKTKALLSLAQTGFNGKVQKFEPVRVDELLWECIETVRTLHPSVKINFDMSLLPANSSKLLVKGNKQLLVLAISNILNNAYKYSDEKLVTVSIAATNNIIIIAIRDNGIGIPPEEIPFVYDPFYRCSNTKKYEGYGIGLPLTRNILAMHYGSILIDSTVNIGTLVEVRLPVMLH